MSGCFWGTGACTLRVCLARLSRPLPLTRLRPLYVTNAACNHENDKSGFVKIVDALDTLCDDCRGSRGRVRMEKGGGGPSHPLIFQGRSSNHHESNRCPSLSGADQAMMRRERLGPKAMEKRGFLARGWRDLKDRPKGSVGGWLSDLPFRSRLRGRRMGSTAMLGSPACCRFWAMHPLWRARVARKTGDDSSG